MKHRPSTTILVLTCLVSLLSMRASAIDCYPYDEAIVYSATTDLPEGSAHDIWVEDTRIFAVSGNTLSCYTAVSPYLITPVGSAEFGTPTTTFCAVAVDGNTAFVLTHDGAYDNLNYLLFQIDVTNFPTYQVTSGRVILTFTQ